MRVCYCQCVCVCVLLCVCIFLACMINQFGTFRWASERKRDKRDSSRAKREGTTRNDRRTEEQTDKESEQSVKQRGRGSQRKAQPKEERVKQKVCEIHVRTYVCVYVCMYVCMCVCMYVYVCMYVCMYVCTYVIVHICMYSIIQSKCNWVCVNVGCVQCIIYASQNSQKSHSPSLSLTLSDVKTALKLTSALLFALWHLSVVVFPFTLSPLFLTLSFRLFPSVCSLCRRRLWQI